MLKQTKSPEIGYDRVDPEEIIIRLKELIAYFQRLKKEGRI